MTWDGTLQPPSCAVCGKPVERWAITQDVLGFYIVVECPGEQEEAFLPFREIVAAEEISTGEAFTGRRAIGSGS